MPAKADLLRKRAIALVRLEKYQRALPDFLALKAANEALSAQAKKHFLLALFHLKKTRALEEELARLSPEEGKYFWDVRAMLGQARAPEDRGSDLSRFLDREDFEDWEKPHFQKALLLDLERAPNFWKTRARIKKGLQLWKEDRGLWQMNKVVAHFLGCPNEEQRSVKALEKVGRFYHKPRGQRELLDLLRSFGTSAALQELERVANKYSFKLDYYFFLQAKLFFESGHRYMCAKVLSKADNFFREHLEKSIRDCEDSEAREWIRKHWHLVEKVQPKPFDFSEESWNKVQLAVKNREDDLVKTYLQRLGSLLRATRAVAEQGKKELPNKLSPALIEKTKLLADYTDLEWLCSEDEAFLCTARRQRDLSLLSRADLERLLLECLTFFKRHSETVTFFSKFLLENEHPFRQKVLDCAQDTQVRALRRAETEGKLTENFAWLPEAGRLSDQDLLAVVHFDRLKALLNLKLQSEFASNLLLLEFLFEKSILQTSVLDSLSIRSASQCLRCLAQTSAQTSVDSPGARRAEARTPGALRGTETDAGGVEVDSPGKPRKALCVGDCSSRGKRINA